MMLVRYLSQIGKYFLMWKEIFNKPTKWSVMRTLIFKEIDDLIIDSLGRLSGSTGKFGIIARLIGEMVTVNAI